MPDQASEAHDIASSGLAPWRQFSSSRWCSSGQQGIMDTSRCGGGCSQVVGRHARATLRHRLAQPHLHAHGDAMMSRGHNARATTGTKMSESVTRMCGRVCGSHFTAGGHLAESTCLHNLAPQHHSALPQTRFCRLPATSTTLSSTRDH